MRATSSGDAFDESRTVARGASEVPRPLELCYSKMTFFPPDAIRDGDWGRIAELARQTSSIDHAQ